MSDLVVIYNEKQLIENIDYTVLGNVINPINEELFKDADENEEIELVIKHTYEIN